MSLRTSGICLAALLAVFLHAASVSGENPRRVTSMDSDWLFTRGDPTNAQADGFDDLSWRRLNVPHDWSIEGPFDEKNPTGGAGGFLPAGVGWYRKHFALPKDYAGRNFFIEFDGVMANSDVWINDFHLGHRPYGYVSFRYELTGHLGFGAGKTNVLTVRVDSSAQPASRWYSGAGIYRHVRLIVTDPLHFDHWATFVSTPAVSSNQATVHLETTVTNQSGRSYEVAVVFEVNGPGLAKPETTQTAVQKVDARSSALFQADILLKTPRLWNLTAPSLYSGSAILKSAGRTLDQDTVAFGIREARFEPDTGFLLNSSNTKIKGVCLHHDCGALGAAVPLSAWQRRLSTLKQLGCNAIRTAHNPPAPEFLDLCDRMGFLVMDEMFDCWTVAKNRHDYHLYFEEWARIDTRDTVRRDRNHPSVIVYSAGNEIHDTPKAELAKRILRGLVEVFHENDPTRPVSQALFRPNVSHDYDNGLADLLDVIGQNYRENEILAAHQGKPTRKILGTENGHDRRVWLALRDNPPYAGQFLWSGIDYLGESRRWPIIGAGSGLLDRTGTPRPRAWQRQSWWSETPMVRMARHVVPVRSTNAEPGGFEVLSRPQTEFCDWTPRNLEPHDEEVEVYSNCGEVELLLNGKSLGRKALPPDAAPRTWTVPFAPGALSTIGRNKGEQVATDELRTAGKPAKVRLTAQRRSPGTDWDEIAYVEAAVVDAQDVLVPDAHDLISFKMSGPGAVVAVDNGDNSSHEPFQASERHAWQGRCFAIIRASEAGKIILTAMASNLAAGNITLQPESSRGNAAAKPLYRDPVYDGAADPTVVWNPKTKTWWMFYTNRRANASGLSGVAWVHGTQLGIAESNDAGASWRYVGTADLDLPPEYGGDQTTHWAPEVITGPNSLHHMFVSVVPGVFQDWNHPRSIVHLTSSDLRHWEHPQEIKLASDRVIDACVMRLDDGTWRLWYNNERDHKSIYYADSRDLQHWEERGKAISDQSGEGPKVFRWQGHCWMITDVWRGLAVYRSEDATRWTRLPGNLLEEPGHGLDDEVKGGHPDVVVSGERAFLFYFTHPGRRGADARKDGSEQRRSSVQVVELVYKDGRLTCERDGPTYIRLDTSGS